MPYCLAFYGYDGKKSPDWTPTPREAIVLHMVHRSTLERFAPWFLIVFFSIAYVGAGWYKYERFQTGLDLAAYTQALFNVSHLRLPFDSFKGIIMWGDHAHFILVLLAPLYRLWPDARLLILVQALAVTTAGWPVYQVAKKITASTGLSMSLLFSCLAFVGTQYALVDDFHPSVLTGAALCWLFYGLVYENQWVYWSAFVLSLLTREDAPTITFMIGLFILLQRRWKLAIPTLLISAGYFLLVAYAIMPIWSPGHVPLLYVEGADKSVYGIAHGFWEYPLAIGQNMFDTPQKVSTTFTLLASFGFVPLLSPLTYLGAAPILYARFNGTEDYRWLITNYSNGNIMPILVFGALFGIGTVLMLVRKTKRPWATRMCLGLFSLLLCAGTLTAWRDPAAPLVVFFRSSAPTPEAKEDAHTFRDATSAIPATDGISTTSGFLAHVANRENIQNYPDTNTGTAWVLLSDHGNPWPLTRDKAAYAIKQLQKNPGYAVAAHQGSVWLFRRL